MSRVPLASGFLSGKYKPGAQFKPGDYRHEKEQQEIDQKLREVEQIRRTEVPPGVDMAQWALAWCLQHPAVTCVIPGCKSVEQVESNAAAAELAAGPRRSPAGVALTAAGAWPLTKRSLAATVILSLRRIPRPSRKPHGIYQP